MALRPLFYILATILFDSLYTSKMLQIHRGFLKIYRGVWTLLALFLKQ